MTKMKLSDLPDGFTFDTEAEFRKFAKRELERDGFEVKALSADRRTYRQLANLGDFEVRRPTWQKGQFVRIEVKLGQCWRWSSEEQELDYHNGKFELFLWKTDVEEFIRRN